MKREKKYRSLQFKLMYGNVLVTVGIILLIEIGIYSYSTKISQRDAVRMNREVVETMGQCFDTSVAAFQNQISAITMSEEVQTQLRKETVTEYDRLVLARELKSAIVLKTLSVDDVDDVYVYDRDKSLLTFWRKKPAAGTNGIFLDTPQGKFLDTGAISTELYKGKLIYNRTILDTKNLTVLGYITFVYDMDRMQELLGTIAPDDNRFVAAVTASGESINYGGNGSESTLNAILEKADGEYWENDTFITLPDGEEVLVCKYDSRVADWGIFFVTSKTFLLRSTEATVMIVVVFGILGILLGILIQFILSRRIVQPLTQMTRLVEQVEAENYTVHMDIHTGDEVERLANSFNHMVDQLDILVNQKLRDELRYKEMQLTALQSQVEPHFLYNTLECINALTQLGRKEDVRRVTVAFSNLMKSLAKGPKTVTLGEELEYTESFLIIYKIQLEDRMSYHIEVEEGLEKMKIPRMMIQPLVENAVLHGIRPCGHPGHVSVSVCSTPTGVLISVTDDGNGMEEEYVRKLKAQMSRSLAGQENEISVGMRNVSERLRLVYGNRAHMDITSYPDWGTTVDLFIETEEGK